MSHSTPGWVCRTLKGMTARIKMLEMTKINFGGEPSLKGAESVSVFDICPAYQVLAETVQAGILYFPALLDDHEGKDTEKSCNLEPIREW